MSIFSRSKDKIILYCLALIENTILNFISAVFAKQSNGRKFEIDNLYIHCHVKQKNAPQSNTHYYRIMHYLNTSKPNTIIFVVCTKTLWWCLHNDTIVTAKKLW